MDNRLKKQLDFICEVDKIKQIFRQSYLCDGSRKENDAEHSWHLALMAIILSEYANEEIDVLKVISMVLIHDIVEIDAGDTYAYDTAGNETKRERELGAAQRIFNILPKDQALYIRSLWDEFEERLTPESKFANMLDRVQPLTLNDASGGKAWTEHDVKLSQVISRNKTTAEGSEELWKYVKENMIEANVKKGAIIDDM